MPANSQSVLRPLAATLVGWINDPSVVPPLMFVGGGLLMLLLGDPMIEWLRHKRWRGDAETWQVREDTPDSHLAKQGTPSMGGIGITFCACFAFVGLESAIGLLLLKAMPRATPTVLGLTTVWPGAILVPVFVAAHALLGFADDWSKASGRGGLRARSKFGAQVLLASAFTLTWVAFTARQTYATARYLFPELLDLLGRGWSPALAMWLAVVAVVIVATGNAVNLTDGIDGLAAGLAVQAGVALWFTGPGIYEIGYFSNLFLAALAGACLGFLWFNRHPARVFMGDTGSLAIGAALGIGAVVSKAVFLLPFIGFIYFAEMLSVIAQVGYFKWTKKREGAGRRIFRRAPLHHHFELSGWTEWRVVLIFWAVNAVVSACGLYLWTKGKLPPWPR